jgi:3D (Asp-Asp-Asp) domain-containing protein
MITLGTLMGFLLFSGAQAITPLVANTETAPTLPSYTVALTAYNAVPEQTSSHPLITASGAYSNPEVIAARSQDFASELPFGTIIELDGSNISSKNTCGFDVVKPHIGYRVIGDVLNAIYTKRIDILLDTKTNYVAPDGSLVNAANVLGICQDVTIRVVGFVAIAHIPKTQDELAALVEKNNSLAVK